MIRGKFFNGYIDDLKDCFDIRRKVFIDEQNISETEEFDGVDEQCGHYVVYNEDDQPVSTSRLIKISDELYQIGRVATLKEYRHKGYAEFLMLSLMEKARSLGAKEIHLLAQIPVVGFYEKCGFVVDSHEVILDAGIEHYQMKHIMGLHKTCCDCSVTK